MQTRATGTTVAPSADSKRHALLSAHVWPLSELLRSPFPFLLDFNLRETFFRRPSSRDLFLGDYSTALFWTTPTRLDIRETSAQPSHFWPGSLFLLCPYSPLQISFVMGAYCFLFPCGICFYVVSSSACIHLIIFLPQLDLFRVLWPCQFLEGDTEN